MVENILSVTRINTADAKVTKTAEPVEEVVSEAVIRLKKRITDADIHVKVPDDFLMIPMDAMLIEQVIINLLENAIIHSRSEKPIDCFVTCDERYVTFHVRDYGIGIPEDKLATIFDGTGSSSNSDSSRGMESACPSVRQSSPHMTARSQPATFRAKSRQGIIFATLSQPPAAQNSLSRSHAGITLIQSRRNHYECKIIDLNH